MDNGATVSLCSLGFIERLGRLADITESSEHRLLSFTGEPVDPYGIIKLSVRFGEQKFKNIPFYVADLGVDQAIILGQSFWIKQRSVLYNNLGSYAFYLNGRRVPLLDNQNGDEAVNRVLLAPEVIKPPNVVNNQDPMKNSYLNQEATIFREVTLDPHQRSLIKVRLSESAPTGQQVLLQQADPHIRFPDQTGTVLEGQMPGKHTRACVNNPNCLHGRSYKFTYLMVENVSGNLLRIQADKVIAIVSKAYKAHIASIRRSIHKTVAEGLPDHFDKDRVTTLLKLLGGKCPDQPHCE